MPLRWTNRKLARRPAKTHSPAKPLSFREICEEAFGVLNIHPWEFWGYTYEDYILKRNGYYRGQEIGMKAKLRTEWQHFRLLAYYVIQPHLKDSAKAKPWTQIVPDIYSDSEPVDPGQFQEWFEKKREGAKKRLEKNKQRLQKIKNAGKRP